ncbi:class I SAM-dependent methyltransferase, partial [Clavibacter michiganensis subsp. insidiosus]
MPDLDPRLVALYDGDNPDGPDHDFDRALAEEVGARSVLDLGCGTGMLTVSLATAGRRVVGVDPSAAMLDVARGRPGG